MAAIDTTIFSFQPDYLNAFADERPDGPLTNSSPDDSRLDEKVIVNEQRSNKTVNAPSQTAANTSEDSANDEELIDEESDKEIEKEKKS